MNRNMPPFDNILVRKALCYSFPYESVIKNILYGRAVQMTSPVPKGAPSHTSEFFPFKHDLKKAKELLKEAGYPNGFSFTFQLGEGRIANNKEIAVAWQAELKKIGINMTIDVLPQAAFLEKLKAKNVPIFMISWTSFVTDPFYQLLFLLGSKSFCNYADIKDAKIDAWIDQAVPEGESRRNDMPFQRRFRSMRRTGPVDLYVPTHVRHGHEQKGPGFLFQPG